MNAFAELALVMFLPAGLLLYLLVPARRATLAVFVLGWLFLPVTGFEFEGVPNYSKITAIVLTVVLGTLLREPRRLLSFRPRWFDAPMALWCIVPFAASISNGLGAYDGMSMMLTQTLTWGVPWVMGRVWFSDAEGMRELAMALVLGGLIYAPLCLWEIRMSPQLHHTIYGSPQSSFSMVARFGGYRPLVFMRTGLEVGLWMSAATLAGLWLWASGTVRQVVGIPLWPLVGVLGMTAILCKSLGAILLLFAGLGILVAARWARLAVPALLLVVLIPGYMAVRATGLWSGDMLVRAAAVVSVDHAESLAFRLENEDLLAERALERPVYGWGGWGRSRVTGERGEDITITDGLWIIALGQFGTVGLVTITAAMLLPIVLLWRRCPPHLWRGPPAVLAVIVLLFAVDSLLNAMPNPMYLLAAGAVCGMSGPLMRAVASAGDGQPVEALNRTHAETATVMVRPPRPGGAIRPIPVRHATQRLGARGAYRSAGGR